MTLGPLFRIVAGMDGNVCVTCGDLVRHLSWRQLALDECHVVRYTAAECACGYRLIAVVVYELQEIE